MYSTSSSLSYSEYPTHEILLADAPILLRQIPKPPKRLFIKGSLPLPCHNPANIDRNRDEFMYLTVVGSRKYSEYAKQTCETLISGLRGLPVVIVSGLALGIDSIAHNTAIENGLKTIAIPGSGLNEHVIYPPTHLGLAKKILDNGGALISIFENDTPGAPWTFPNRNRIMAGISHATLVIEADIKSGTLITSKFAGDFNRDVLAVPGSIFSPQSNGPHMLIRGGATPITCQKDLREALGFEEKENYKNRSNQEKLKLTENLSRVEQLMLEALGDISMSKDELFETLSSHDIKINEMNVAISLLEMNSLIEEKLGEFRLI